MYNSCWITGASSGIGKHTALYFAKKGFTVFASARSSTDLEKLVNESLTLSQKGSIIAVPLDVTIPDEISKSIEFIKNNVESLDFVILNAGTYLKENSKFATIKSTKYTIDFVLC